MILKVIKTNNIIFLLFTFILSLISTKILPINSESYLEKNDKEVISKTIEASIQDSEYILGSGDVLEIKILDDETLNEQNEVLNDGTMSIPIIGNMKISGLSIKQATNLIEAELGKELIRPNVRIVLRQSRPMKIAVLGEVQNPGIYTISNNESSAVAGRTTNLQGPPTLINAIQKSGGITPLANLNEIQITRRLPGFSKEYKQAKINLLEAILEGNHEYNILLFDKDKIFIPKATIDSSEKSEMAATNLAPSFINVYFVGEINGPGKATLPSNTPLIQGIMSAGGPRYWRGSTGNVQLVRINRNGTITNRKLAINLTDTASRELNPILKNGDIVRINRTKIATVTDAITEVTKPFTGYVTALSVLELLK